MRQSIRIGTFAGVDVGVNWSVLVIFALVTWELADWVLPRVPGNARAVDWVAAIAAALAFFASLLAHEASHALVARRNGVGVRSITLWLFGGVAELESESPSAGADFRIAAVGPGTSLALAALFGLAQGVAEAAGVRGLPVAVLAWLWEINLLLAVFNLLPGAPLDGGRILRAGLWRAWGDRVRAAVAAARAGRVLGMGLIGVGLLGFLAGGPVDRLALWSALIGWFLFAAAGTEERVARQQGAMSQVRVWQVMTPSPPCVPARTTVSELVGDTSLRNHGDAVVLTDDRGWLAGVVTGAALRSVAAEQMSQTPLSAIALPLSAVPVVGAHDPVVEAIARMAASPGAPALVLDSQYRLAGILTQADLRRLAGGRAAPPPFAQPAGR